jgi:hypothetical protein
MSRLSGPRSPYEASDGSDTGCVNEATVMPSRQGKTPSRGSTQSYFQEEKMNDEQLGTDPETTDEAEGHKWLGHREAPADEDDAEGHKWLGHREGSADDDVQGHQRGTGGGTAIGR